MMLLSLAVLVGCQGEPRGAPTTTEAPAIGDPPACRLVIGAPDETGIPELSLSWSMPGTPPDALEATVSFFGQPDPGVTLHAAYDLAGITGSRLVRPVPLLPVERTDGQTLQEHFRDSGLDATVTVSATWSDGTSCADTLTVPFRTWAQIDETCTADCVQPADLLLPTALSVTGLDETVAESMADVVLSSIYFRASTETDNYTLATLPLTGTPLQLSRVGDDLLDTWDTEHKLSTAQVLNCSAWRDGRELVITQGYPSLDQAVSILLDSDESVLGFGYTQESEPLWLHHNCFLDPQVTGDVVPLYTLSWVEQGEEERWSSDVVRVDVDLRDGGLVGAAETIVEAAALTDAVSRYSNGLTLSPAGVDGQQWIGVSFANDNDTPLERERAFFLSMPLLADGAGPPRFLFVNADEFDTSSLAEGWQEAWPELEIVGLPSDPVTGFYPIDFPHNIELFKTAAGIERDGALWDTWRLIIASINAEFTSNYLDYRSEVYQFTIHAPADGEGESVAELFCATSMPVETRSHFDLVLPASAEGVMSWVGAFTAEPSGALFWLDLWEADADQRCRVVGAQSLTREPVDGQHAVPIWSTETDPVALFGSMFTSVSVHYNADVLRPAMQ